jgi:heat shock protein HspQ
MKMMLVFLVLAVQAVAEDPGTISQDELMHRTQAMYDAVAPGDKSPWQRYLADDAIIHDEKGGSYTKPTLVATVEPMPKGYTGTIQVTHPQTIFAPGVAIFSYDTDEVETVFGNRMTARYHQTDTWLYRNHLWQIAASQVMRYYEDPASITLGAALLADYAGVYEMAPGRQITITAHDGKLFAQRENGKPAEMLAEAPDLFFRPGVEGRRLFRRGADGKVDVLVDRRNNEDMLWRKVK